MSVPAPRLAYEPSGFQRWTRSLTPAGSAIGSVTARESRVHDVNGMTAASAARAYERVLAGREMNNRARDQVPSAQQINDPVTTTPNRPPPPKDTTPPPTQAAPSNSAPPPPPPPQPDRSDGDESINHLNPQPQVPAPAAAVPSPAQTPAQASPGATSAPPAQTDDSPSTIPLQDLGLLPGGNPRAEMPYPQVSAPSTSLAVVAALAIPEGSSVRQVSQETNGAAITATQIDVPGRATVVGTSVTGTPLELEVAGTCALPVRVPAASPLPGSIMTPDIIFRTGRGYSADQLRSDLDTVAAGEAGLSSAEAGLAYAAARARLNSAMYTPIEQFNDLQWANHEPRTEAEERDRFEARARLNEAGIPWLDPRIEEWIDNKLDVTIATDPTNPARYQAPPLFSPSEIRRQQIEASRVDITGNDLRQGANDFLAAVTYGPALVLWEAAHDRGDHSGADIAWAAAELGLNVIAIVPGVGALTGVAAKATVRRLAPEFWNVLTTTDKAADAVRAGQALHDARVTNAALDYRQKFVLDSNPAQMSGAGDASTGLAGGARAAENPATPSPARQVPEPLPIAPVPATQSTTSWRPVPVRGTVTDDYAAEASDVVVGAQALLRESSESLVFTGRWTTPPIPLAMSRVPGPGSMPRRSSVGTPGRGGAISSDRRGATNWPQAYQELDRSQLEISYTSVDFRRSGGDPVRLFHGTTDAAVASILNGIKVSSGRANLDFGQGFYTSTNLKQVETWARRLAEKRGGQPAILEYQLSVDELNSLDRLVLGDDYQAWARFILDHRSGRRMHPYDIVEGPYVMNPAPVAKGIASPVPGGQQLSWHTDRSVRLLGNGYTRHWTL